MKILICNDDGIFSESLKALAIMLYNKGNEVTVVAPASNCSGFSHHVSFFKQVKVEKIDFFKSIDAYSLTGTPVDCVIYGMKGLNKDYDVILAGINLGSNIGSEVLYSGTLSIGAEANSFGYKAIAFSCENYKAADFNHVADICCNLLEKFYPHLSSDFTLNINVPHLNGEPPKGIKVTPLGLRLYSDTYEWVDENTFMLTGDPIKADNPKDCDVEWSAENYITVTPVLCNRTALKALRGLKGALLDD